MRRPPPPLWVQIVAAVALGLVCRHALGSGPPTRGHVLTPQLAFWPLLATIIGFVWDAIQVAGEVTLEALAWSVHFLMKFASGAADVFKAFGSVAVDGFRQAYRGLRTLYDDILVPAWRKFWGLVDWAQRTLHQILDPVINAVLKVRKAILDFYAAWVRPVLDLIDVGRRALRILAQFGLDWAAALDQKLGDLEAFIDRPFQILLAKVNEIINLVNTVVTADGLFQRLALLRSLARDAAYAWNQLAKAPLKPMSAADREASTKRGTPKTYEQVKTDVRDYLQTGGGNDAPLLDEMTGVWRKYLQASP